MKTEYEKYRETGMLGGYDPHGALLRETESGEVLTSFRDTCYQSTRAITTSIRGRCSLEGRYFM